MKLIGFLMALSFAAFANNQVIENVENQLKQDLEGEGVDLWVHGAYSKGNLYVLTWRDPSNFFNRLDYPLYSKNLDLTTLDLHRHDQVRVKGLLISRRNAPSHIEAKSIKILSRYSGHSEELQPRDFSLKDLETKDRGVFQIHTIYKNTLVVEYDDVVLPMMVRKWHKNLDTLFRGDTVRLSYKLMRHRPDAPPHLVLNTREPYDTLLSIQEIHNEPAHLTGCLAMFPKSPQIKFDIFAIVNEDAWGYRRNFTIVNFKDFDLFMSVREKLSNAWDGGPKGQIVFKRNHFVNCGVQVTATGTYNLVSPNQANPQILVDSLEDIKI